MMILGSNQPALHGLHLALRRISQRKGDQAALGDAQATRGELVARSNMRRGAKSKLLEHPASAFNALAMRLHGGAGSPIVTMSAMAADHLADDLVDHLAHTGPQAG
ncbi:hypothetical protein [Bradyrhizobium sp. S69]|uniref:hypothetical protein n=1 Tax=Bradyrhizobium sp. S69 TaxID=1641856 RepID=UPI001AEF091B|nr:hypothetical protein [Bradyrhizobium sp. S69]